MSKDERPLRAAVVGLDGATFDVIRPLVRAGHLPVLARLLESGSSGVLHSIIPPMTGPAWSVLATGRNPGKLGIFDFINRHDPSNYRLHPITSRDLAGKTFWDVLTEEGYRVGVFNYPMLVPAYPIDGWMVAGLGASKLHRYTFPPELAALMDHVAQGYEINVSFGLPKYRDDWVALVADMRASLRKRIAVLDHLIDRDPVDVLVAVFGVSDVASHTLWRFWLQGEASSDPAARRLRDDYIDIWSELDSALGRVLDRLASDGHALIVSDHGFGTSHGVFHVNSWLVDEGLLHPRSDASGLGNRVRHWLLERSKPLFKALFRRLEGSAAHQVLRASILREIDLDNSKAFALENSDGYGGIYIHRGYAHARGLDEAAFVATVREEIRDRLRAWSGQSGIDIDVHFADEIYSGDKVALAPEVIVIVNGGEGSVSHRLQRPVFANRPHHPMKSGTHRQEGILIATGPKISGAPARDARLQDIAPTLLHLLGARIDPDVDGRVLAEMLIEEHSVPSEPRSCSADPPEKPFITANEDEDGFEDMIERLRDLGYLE